MRQINHVARRTNAGMNLSEHNKLHRAMLHAARTQAPLLRARRLSVQPRGRRLASSRAHAGYTMLRARRLCEAARTQACKQASKRPRATQAPKQPRARRLDISVCVFYLNIMCISILNLYIHIYILYITLSRPASPFIHHRRAAGAVCLKKRLRIHTCYEFCLL